MKRRGTKILCIVVDNNMISVRSSVGDFLAIYCDDIVMCTVPLMCTAPVHITKLPAAVLPFVYFTLHSNQNISIDQKNCHTNIIYHNNEVMPLTNSAYADIAVEG